MYQSVVSSIMASQIYPSFLSCQAVLIFTGLMPSHDTWTGNLICLWQDDELNHGIRLIQLLSPSLKHRSHLVQYLSTRVSFAAFPVIIHDRKFMVCFIPTYSSGLQINGCQRSCDPLSSAWFILSDRILAYVCRLFSTLFQILLRLQRMFFIGQQAKVRKVIFRPS